MFNDQSIATHMATCENNAVDHAFQGKNNQKWRNSLILYLLTISIGKRCFRGRQVYPQKKKNTRRAFVDEDGG